MLAPEDIAPVNTLIKNFLYNIVSTDRVSYMLKTVRIYPIIGQHQWIDEWNRKMSKYRISSIEWERTRMPIISDSISSFVEYSDLFTAVKPFLENTEECDVVIHILNKLIKRVEKNLKCLQLQEQNFNEYLKSTSSLVLDIDDSIKKGWNNVDASEAEVMHLVSIIHELQDKIIELNNKNSLTALDSTTILDLKDCYSQLGSICYSMIVNELSCPYISVGFLVFTFGKTIYDFVSNATEFQKRIEQLSMYSEKLTLEQKALVQTKAAIRLLYSINQVAVVQNNSMNQIVDFWNNEKRNLETVKSNLLSAKTYTKENTEILQLPIAQVIWQMVQQNAKHVLQILNSTNLAKEEQNRKIDILL